jgi:hypothetical protein
MDDQPFAYYQNPPNYDSYPALQYSQSSYDAEVVGNDDSPFINSNYVCPQPQDSAPGWSTPFATPDANGVAFQRRGAVSGEVPGQTSLEVSNDTAPRGLRIDTSCVDSNGRQHRSQEVGSSSFLGLQTCIYFLASSAYLGWPMCRSWLDGTQ